MLAEEIPGGSWVRWGHSGQGEAVGAMPLFPETAALSLCRKQAYSVLLCTVECLELDSLAHPIQTGLSLLHTHHVLPAQSLPDPDTFGEAAGGEVKSLHGFKSWLHALDPIA